MSSACAVFFIKTVEAVVLVIVISMALSGGVEPQKTALYVILEFKVDFSAENGQITYNSQ